MNHAATIEAANEREEALAIAIALRLALEKQGRNDDVSRAALITPDRKLARRVSAELARTHLPTEKNTKATHAMSRPQGRRVDQGKVDAMSMTTITPLPAASQRSSGRIFHARR